MKQRLDLSRRQFGAMMMGATAGWMASRGAACAIPAEGPLFGISASLDVAPQIKAAGGDFLGLSVAGFLNPDSSDEAFTAKLKGLKDCPLPIKTCNSFIRRKDLHCTGPEANHDDVMAYCIKAFERAQRAGVSIITFGSSGSRRLPGGFSRDQAMDQFVALLKRMGPPAADHGVTVVVEPLQKRECNFINNIGDVEESVRRTDHPAIRGAADLYHMVIEGDTPADMAQAADIVHHVEIAEAEGRRMPGTGGQDFRAFFTPIKKLGFSGTILVEGKWDVSELPVGFAEMRKQWNEA